MASKENDPLGDIDPLFEDLFPGEGNKRGRQIRAAWRLATRFLPVLTSLFGRLRKPSFSGRRSGQGEDERAAWERMRLERVHRAQNFAAHVAAVLASLDRPEDFSDPLIHVDTEVDAYDKSSRTRFFGLSSRPYTGLRRESSILRAFDTSYSRLILLQGEPGSGKSVALRRLGRQLALRAAGTTSSDIPIPIYVNLKHLSRSDDQQIDGNLIQNFILESFASDYNWNVDEYISDEFSRRLADGKWVFLFDSFDEIPEILTSTEADSPAVISYENALEEFMDEEKNGCRAFLASRYFHGPAHLQWSVFDLIGLSLQERIHLVKQFVTAAIPRHSRHSTAGFRRSSSDLISNNSSALQESFLPDAHVQVFRRREPIPEQRI